MFLTDWEVCFQVLCFRALSGKAGQLFSQHPWPLQLLPLRRPLIVSATFGPSQSKLLSTENGKLEVLKNAKSGYPVFQVVTKEAAVWLACVWTGTGKANPGVPFLPS